MQDKPLRVYVVDDDPLVRGSLQRLLAREGYKVVAAGSARAFLDLLSRDSGQDARCAVFDVCLPDLSGMDLQRELASIPGAPPIVFITGQGDIPMSVRAMKEGAVDFLCKPFGEEAILAAVEKAVKRDEEGREERRKTDEASRLVESLTGREMEVLRWIVTGRLNKQIAAVLGVTEKMVKVHRARVLQKLGASSVADLVRIAQKAGVHVAEKTQEPELKRES